MELSTQCPVNLKHTGSFLLPVGAWPAVAGAAPELVAEAGADDEGACEAVEAGVDADCPAAGASWAWAAGMAARIVAATAAVIRAAPASRRPGATNVAKFAALPVDLIVRLTFICHGASVGRNLKATTPCRAWTAITIPMAGYLTTHEICRLV